ncbi:MAG: hypothetical protein M1816_002515 [Peltula sp. TS41687]|nr:MAG: hypothetical protein M1816_002515 [Peltula sp. TS41687]
MFGTFGTNAATSQQQTTNSPSPFGLLGSQNNNSQATGKNMFGSTFGGLNTSQSQQQQQQTGNNMFGNLNVPQQQPQQKFSFPAATTTQQAPQQGTPALALNNTLFQPAGNNQQQQQQQQPLGRSLFGNIAPQQQQPLGEFGLGSNLQQQQQQQQVQPGNLLGQSQFQQGLGSLWQPGSGLTPRQKSIPEQLLALAEKWSPTSPNCAFQRYFYNHVGEARVPYYRPTPNEDERKWEEALAKKPGPGYIPVLLVGFESLGMRLQKQVEYLAGYNMRLHQINDGLTLLLNKHDLIISVRTQEAKRKHQALSARFLALATKVQVLRNRGYAMSGDEEELKKKLLGLERAVFDPALQGRSSEIWARMVSIRARVRALHDQIERSANDVMNGLPEVLDEEVMRKASKVLEDYASQLTHLRNELEQIQMDFKEWETMANPSMNGTTTTMQTTQQSIRIFTMITLERASTTTTSGKMSLLSVVHPVESCAELLDVIRKQIDSKRLEVCGNTDPKEVTNPTRALKRLVSLFQGELNAQFKFVSLVSFGVKGVLDLPISSTCYVFCVQKNEDGGGAGATWFDGGKKVDVEGMTLLKCDDGCLKTMGRGGTYLLLWVDDPKFGQRSSWGSGGSYWGE